MGKLTDREIANYRLPDDAGKHSDGEGLTLELLQSGKKRWLYRYRVKDDGKWKENTIVLGYYPTLTLAQARQEHMRQKALVASGVNPSHARRQEAAAEAERNKEQLQAVNSFQSVALEWVELQAERWTPAHTKATKRTLELNVFPSIGITPVDKITPPDILAIIRAIEARGALEMARKTLERINGACRYAVQTGRALYNPASDMQGVLKPKRVVNHPALSKERLPAFLAALRQGDLHLITQAAIRFTILTAARSGEVRLATWDEIDHEASLWRVPAERMKMRRPHTVPLSRQAMTILEAMHAHATGEHGYIFPGIHNPLQPLSGNTMLYGLYRIGFHSETTMHGFRATFSTVANEVMQFDKDALERALAHQEGNQIRAAYHRSEYLDERRVIMQWWADWLDAMERSGQVEPPEAYIRRG